MTRADIYTRANNGYENSRRIINIQSAATDLEVAGSSGSSLCGNGEPRRSDSDKPATIVFVCLHGSVKSQMAAAHFNRIAKERGLLVVAISRGIALDDNIPPSIRGGLAGDGLAPPSDVPLALTSEEAATAAKIFAFDEIPAELKGRAEVTYRSDVPPATKDYAAARNAIVRHLFEVIGSMTPSQ